MAGADGDITWQNAWVITTVYTTNQAVENDGSSYVCILNHTASASDEPGVGGSWTTYWDLMADKGDTGPAGPASAGYTLLWGGALSSTGRYAVSNGVFNVSTIYSKFKLLGQSTRPLTNNRSICPLRRQC